jgi:addiction module HigA family antidote
MIHSPAHPGSILGEELAELGISVSRASKELGVSRQTLSAIVNARSPITPDMAVKIGHYVGNGAEIWARMQMNHDLWHAERRMEKKLKNMPRASNT